MKKNTVELNESIIRDIVKESLRRTLLEVIRNKKKLNECGGSGGYGGCGGSSGYGSCGHFYRRSYYNGCGMGQSHC